MQMYHVATSPLGLVFLKYFDKRLTLKVTPCKCYYFGFVNQNYKKTFHTLLTLMLPLLEKRLIVVKLACVTHPARIHPEL
jgi:hypothetical protein